MWRKLTNFNVVRRFWMLDSRRTLLSKAYRCENEWEARKNSPSLYQVDPYDLQTTMMARFNSGNIPSAVDFDILANSISHQDQLPDFEDLLWKFRHCSNTASTLNSTHHAISRFCLDLKSENLLMKYLNDPINYGVFPDPYIGNMIMDHFLNNGNHRDAAKVAGFLMLQEEFDVDSTRCFMILSCLRWAKEQKPNVEETPSNVDENDEVIMRLPWLKNPFDDDHFDIEDINQLAGKTLIWTSDYSTTTNADELEKQILSNCKLMGFVLRNNRDHIVALLSEMISNEKFKIYKDMIDKIEHVLKPSEEKPIKEEPASENAKKETKKEESLDDPVVNKIKEFIALFKKSERLIDANLVDVFNDYFVKRLPDLEKIDMEQIKAMFVKWDADRERKINNQIQYFLKKERLKLVDKQLRDFEFEEDVLTFFENKNNWEKKIPEYYFTKTAELQVPDEKPKKRAHRLKGSEREELTWLKKRTRR